MDFAFWTSTSVLGNKKVAIGLAEQNFYWQRQNI
jgi:hypothetical protein